MIDGSRGFQRRGDRDPSVVDSDVFTNRGILVYSVDLRVCNASESLSLGYTKRKSRRDVYIPDTCFLADSLANQSDLFSVRHVHDRSNCGPG